MGLSHLSRGESPSVIQSLDLAKGRGSFRLKRPLGRSLRYRATRAAQVFHSADALPKRQCCPAIATSTSTPSAISPSVNSTPALLDFVGAVSGVSVIRTNAAGSTSSGTRIT